MGKKIEPFNLSAAERAIERPTERTSSCKLGEKVGVKLPKQNKTLPLKNVAVSHTKEGSAKQDPDQYLDFSKVKGMTFRVPACPCTEGVSPIYSTTVNSPQDFEQLKDDLRRAVWMENRVCGHMPGPASGNSPTVQPQRIMSPDIVLKMMKPKVVRSLLTMGAANLGTMGIAAAALSVYARLPGESHLSATANAGVVAGLRTVNDSSSNAQLVEACTQSWVEEQCEGAVKLPEY